MECSACQITTEWHITAAPNPAISLCFEVSQWPCSNMKEWVAVTRPHPASVLPQKKEKVGGERRLLSSEKLKNK